MWDEGRFIAFSCGGRFAGVVSGFLGYDGNGDSVALEKVAARSLFLLKIKSHSTQLFSTLYRLTQWPVP